MSNRRNIDNDDEPDADEAWEEIADIDTGNEPTGGQQNRPRMSGLDTRRRIEDLLEERRLKALIENDL